MYRELYQLYILTMITVLKSQSVNQTSLPIIIVIGIITVIALITIAMSLIKLNRNLDANCYEDTKTINEDTDFTVTDFD